MNEEKKKAKRFKNITRNVKGQKSALIASFKQALQRQLGRRRRRRLKRKPMPRSMRMRIVFGFVVSDRE